MAGHRQRHGNYLERHADRCHGGFQCHLRKCPGATGRSLVQHRALHRKYRDDIDYRTDHRRAWSDHGDDLGFRLRCGPGHRPGVAGHRQWRGAKLERHPGGCPGRRRSRFRQRPDSSGRRDEQCGSIYRGCASDSEHQPDLGTARNSSHVYRQRLRIVSRHRCCLAGQHRRPDCQLERQHGCCHGRPICSDRHCADSTEWCVEQCATICGAGDGWQHARAQPAQHVGGRYAYHPGVKRSRAASGRTDLALERSNDRPTTRHCSPPLPPEKSPSPPVPRPPMSLFSPAHCPSAP